MNKRGIILVEVIIIITLLAVIVSGVTIYIAETLRFDVVTIQQDKALYAAQAGVMRSIVDYELNGSITAVTDAQIEGDLYYTTGGAGMFFLADASSPDILANRFLRGISMTNLSSTDDLTITHMQVSWTPDSGENLIGIDFGRATVEWSGTAASGTNLDMIDYTIAAGDTENDIWLDWEVGSDITAMTISALLTFSDGSTLEIVLLDEGSGSSNAITITSTGIVVAADTWRRTLEAAYDVGTSEIISWDESQDHL